jgi:hypothetical protein
MKKSTIALLAAMGTLLALTSAFVIVASLIVRSLL